MDHDDVKIKDGFFEGVGGPTLRELGPEETPGEGLPKLTSDRRQRIMDRLYLINEGLPPWFPIRRRRR